MTKDKEPLPCPFCGVTPELDEGGVTVFPCKTRFCPASHTAVLLTHWNTRAKPDLPVHEQMARFAIDGAITSGYQGTNKPEEDHWLYPFWAMGEKLMKAEVQHTGSCPLCDQRAAEDATWIGHPLTQEPLSKAKAKRLITQLSDRSFAPDGMVLIPKKRIDYLLMRGNTLTKAIRSYLDAKNAFDEADEEDQLTDEHYEDIGERYRNLTGASYEYTKCAEKLRDVIAPVQEDKKEKPASKNKAWGFQPWPEKNGGGNG